MWFELGVIYLAALSIADFSLFNYIGFDPRVSYIEFSVISGLWSAAFISTSELLGRLADRGEHRSLALISTAAIGTSAALFTLSRGSVALLGAAYLFHAVSTASANLAFSTSLFELSPAETWESRTSVQRLGLYSIRGVGLLALAMIAPLVGVAGPVAAVLFTGTLVGLTFLTSLTPSLPLLERRLNKVLNNLASLRSYSASLAAFVGGRYGVLYSLSSSLWERSRSPMRVALSASFAAFVGDYFLTALPLYLRASDVTFRGYSLAFGVAGVVTAGALVFVDVAPAETWLAATLVGARGAWMSLGLGVARGIAGLTLYLVPSYALFASIDLQLYRIFVRRSSGYGVHSYAILKEMGSLTGSFVGGVAILAGPLVFLGLPLSASAASALLLLMT